MATKQTDIDKTVQQNGCLSFMKQATALVLALAALAGIFVAGTMYSVVAQSLSSEPVYEATLEQVNPALEGKLVKMRVTELVAEGGPLTDETFGLRMENTIALKRFYRTECSNGRFHVIYNELHGIRKALILAPDVKAGAYSLRARESFWEDLGGEYLNPDVLTLPAAWTGRVVSRTKHGITLRTDDTSNLAVPNVDFEYMRIPSPRRGVLHMVGRQQGNVLDLTGEGCGLIRGEQEYQKKTRIHSLPVVPTGECCLWVLGLTGAITLSLLPGVLILQKRGLLRAVSVAALLGILLIALVASAFLLLPYAEHNWLTWLYTLLPGLIALVLLGFACRK